MKEDFILFSKQLDTIKSSDIISFKKLFNKKLSVYLLTGSEIAKDELYKLQLSFNKFINTQQIT